jgi:hypothetical protein
MDKELAEKFKDITVDKPGWYWAKNFVAKVSRDESGKLWTQWATCSSYKLFPAGPRCLSPQEIEALQKEVEHLKALLEDIPCQLCDIGDFRASCTCVERGKKRDNQKE